MELAHELLPGAQLVMLKHFADDRGSFVKSYSSRFFDTHAEPFDLREEFYSFSRKDVIRGMHFQVPPHDHVKIVYCAAGAVLDVLVDLRRGPGQGRVASVVLDAAKPSLLTIPRGIAHGFKSLRDDSLMIYKTSTEHSPAHDKGIHWDSFGFNWGLADPILSQRDRAHPSLADFQSPF